MDRLLAPGVAVSRETEERLRSLVALLIKWNPAINLVAKSTLPVAWERHVIDSAQLFSLAEFDFWADLGSGGGFPGLVIAVLCAESGKRMTLVEVDQRKATFLREAARQLDLEIDVRADRIELLDPLCADVISARALAPLSVLCSFAAYHLRPGGTALFPKGASWRAELEEARKVWKFEYAVIASETDTDSVVLKVKAIEHV